MSAAFIMLDPLVNVLRMVVPEELEDVKELDTITDMLNTNWLVSSGREGETVMISDGRGESQTDR